MLFVGGPEPYLKALVESTDGIPIVVCATDFDPQAKGYVKSLARPGKNVTGVHLQQTEINGKRLELLRDLLPVARRMSVFSDNNTEDQREAAQKAAQILKLELHVVKLRDLPYDYAAAVNLARAAAIRRAAGSHVAQFFRWPRESRGRGQEAQAAHGSRTAAVCRGGRAGWHRMVRPSTRCMSVPWTSW